MLYPGHRTHPPYKYPSHPPIMESCTAQAMTPPDSSNGLPTQVLVITGKKANRAFREARWTPPKVPHQEADLSQKGLNVEKADTQSHESKET